VSSAERGVHAILSVAARSQSAGSKYTHPLAMKLCYLSLLVADGRVSKTNEYVSKTRSPERGKNTRVKFDKCPFTQCTVKVRLKYCIALSESCLRVRSPTRLTYSVTCIIRTTLFTFFQSL
jgi:hypothetical protein